jgi:hypothetical protein
MGDPDQKNYYHKELKSIDDLLARDKQREEDGFPRKIRLGRIFRPGKTGKDNIIIVPTVEEEKFYHDIIRFKNNTAQNEQTGGSGEGEEGEVIGEVPVHGEKEGEGGAGTGSGGDHEVTSSAYDLGKILTEKFKLPNLHDRGKKKTFTKFRYEMTDKNRGFGQFLDKKATLKRIIRTNQALGRIPDVTNINTSGFLVDPRDKVYRILSKEKDYEAQALVFFIRDYSASMYGKPTEIVTSQHLMIFSWLSYQYEKQVETRFILHDNEAKEVPDFYTYYNLSIAGGTFIASAYSLVNEIVAKESLARDYNIYIFHGTDGDDLDDEGTDAVKELNLMLGYASRIGITVVTAPARAAGQTTAEKYIAKSGFLENKKELLRLSALKENSGEGEVIASIKELIEE